MGCSSSKATSVEINDVLNNKFKVIILNTKGHECSVGKIEISHRELVLHQSGRPSIHWPLAGLRHYGFNEDLFSFESGRRCPTGEGVYAFKCNHAETLFNVLQERILDAAEQHSRRAAINQANLLARFHSAREAITGVATRNRSNDPHLYLNQLDENETGRMNYVSNPITYADLDLPLLNEHGAAAATAAATAAGTAAGESPCVNYDTVSSPIDALRKRLLYINVPYANICAPQDELSARQRLDAACMRRKQASSKHQYENVVDTPRWICSDDLDEPGRVLTGRGRSQSCRTVATLRRVSRKLSLGRGSVVNIRGSDRGLTTAAPSGYSLIDVERTLALSLNNNGFGGDDDGIRKTRHSVSTAETVDLL